MKVHLDCVPCVMRQALQASRLATDDLSKQEKALKMVASELAGASFESTPLKISHEAQRIVRECTDVEDPYREIKEESNREAMEMYPELKKRVSESDDSLLAATKFAIAGNVVDFGPGHEFSLEETVENIQSKEPAIDHFDDFKSEIENSEEIIYLADNAGEIVFDRILLEELKNKEIKFFVKGRPVLNDAMVEDANFAGIDEIADIGEVFSQGKKAGLDSVPERFIRSLEKSDLVISKGQGNYEAFSEVDGNMFFLLLVKCPLVGKDLGVEEGSIIIKQSDTGCK